jgi:hypothetical protein
MSYYCEISFKKIKADRVFDFFTEMKRVCSEHIEEIAEDNYVFTPVFKDFNKIKDYLDSLDGDTLSSQDLYDIAQSVFKSTRDHAKLNMFTFRYFYLPKEEILGVFSTHECIRDLFDLTHSFQNSSDQDYEFSSWDGIDIFEDIAKKWQFASYHELVDAYEEYMCESYNDYSVTLDDYYRKVFAYRDIWGMLSDYLDREECVVYLHLYSYYDCTPINKFMSKCIKCSKEFYNGK